MTLVKIVTALEKMYGAAAPRVTDPFEMILLENASYLVDDERRHETLERLRAAIGLRPEQIVTRSPQEIAVIIADGGMKPEMCAEKVLDCARLAIKAGVTEKTLRKFPGIGEPYADRILLFNNEKVTLAPDSNALRVLLRLGFGKESKSYSTTYRSVVNATSGELRDAKFAQHAHVVLRRHGQEVCRRSAPRCEVCPVRAGCAFYQSGVGS
jgi:endonuclease III